MQVKFFDSNYGSCFLEETIMLKEIKNIIKKYQKNIIIENINLSFNKMNYAEIKIKLICKKKYNYNFLLIEIEKKIKQFLNNSLNIQIDNIIFII